MSACGSCTGKGASNLNFEVIPLKRISSTLTRLKGKGDALSDKVLAVHGVFALCSVFSDVFKEQLVTLKAGKDVYTLFLRADLAKSYGLFSINPQMSAPNHRVFDRQYHHRQQHSESFPVIQIQR